MALYNIYHKADHSLTFVADNMIIASKSATDAEDATEAFFLMPRYMETKNSEPLGGKTKQAKGLLGQREKP